MSIADPIFEFRGVSKAFGRQPVLVDLNLQIERRRTTVIIGRSGCGKSVLLKHAVGLIRPDRGEIYFEGVRVDQLSERALVPIRRQIGFVFQLNALFDSMSVGENVAFNLRQTPGRRPAREHVRRAVERCLDLVGMAGFENKRPAELSGGEKKRVALARAIAMEPPPKVILYDEPTAGLDPQRSDVINKLIKNLEQELELTSIVVTHDMHSAAVIGHRILLLWDGKMISDGNAEELRRSPDPRVRRFIAGEAEPGDIKVFSA